MCVLDLSKELMHEFHYNYIKIKHRNNARLLFTDTDCLMYQIKTEDVYEKFSKDEEILVIFQLSQNFMMIPTN